jgi:hypothetical protein
VGVVKDPAGAKELYVLACARGQAAACYGAAEYAKACGLGHAAACNDFGVAVQPTDMAKALVLYAKACSGGHADGCSNQANLLAKTDKVRALQLLQKACAGNSAVGCANLCVAYRRGVGIKKKNHYLAVVSVRKACLLGDLSACEQYERWGFAPPGKR